MSAVKVSADQQIRPRWTRAPNVEGKVEAYHMPTMLPNAVGVTPLDISKDTLGTFRLVLL